MRIFLTILLSASIILAADQQEKKLKIAVINLKNANGVTAGDAELISDRLRNEFFSTGMVDIMEREQMSEILKEQGFQQSGSTCADEGCMVEIGRLLGVKRLVTGSLGKLGSLYMINVRSINVENGKIEKVVSEDVKGEIEDLVGVIPVIARKIAGPDNNSQPNPVAVQPVQPQVNPDPKEQQSNQESSSSNQTSLETLPCDDNYFMEHIEISSKQAGFELKDFELRDIDEIMSEAISSSLHRKVIVADPKQLAETSCQSTPVFRVRLESYSTKPAKFGQHEGTARVLISLYSSSSAQSPLITVRIERTGDSNFGETRPLINAFSEVADAVEDDFRPKVKQYLEK